MSRCGAMTTIRSEQFDDIYFSPENGLEESRFVFLQNNGLPQRWRDKRHFTVAETGFGTGLNFLATAKLFRETRKEEGRLDYISFERFPLGREAIESALLQWKGEVGAELERLLQCYPLRIPGFHRVHFSDEITLTLVFDDINEAMPQLVAPQGVDVWYLDGFAPAKNPEMWSDTLYSEMGRLSALEATVATFTAAGHVRRGLESAGFSVEKVQGYGRKRDMTVGRLSNMKEGGAVHESKKIAVIGGGLAGTSCAYMLKKRGMTPVIFEADNVAAGASGNPVGLYNPRFSAQRSADSDFYAGAFALAARELAAMNGVSFERCGALHLVTNEDKEKRLRGVLENWGWHSEHIEYVDARRASDIAGVEINKPALFLPDSGKVSPKALCEKMAEGIEVRKQRVDNPKTINDFDAVILACGIGARSFEGMDWLPLHTVRGQISRAAVNGVSSGLSCNVCYGGYISKPENGSHTVGATFQKWLEDTDLRAEDDGDNHDRLKDAIPSLETLELNGERAGLRASTQDRFPLIGGIPDRGAWQEGGDGYVKGLYISAGHGSHGIVSSLYGAMLLADMIAGAPQAAGTHVKQALCPSRFFERARKKGKAF